MNPYLPHTEEERDRMLEVIGAERVDDLFSDIPVNLRPKNELNFESGKSEHEVLENLRTLSAKNGRATSFLGGGMYDRIVPSVVGHVMSMPEFSTAYTPYQAEISQGVLQAIFEFQTYMTMLTGLEVSNASLYDGATAANEAIAMGLASARNRNRVLYSGTLHPHTKQVIETYFHTLDAILEEIPCPNGFLTMDELKPALGDDVAAVLVQTPNFFGGVEDYTGFADTIHEAGAVFIISADPVSLGLLRSPAEWGADIAVGDNQGLGLAPHFGGPSVGYIAATKKLLRKMPGRIVGQTLDADGKRAFVLTLQAREQHIKRERATSNICSNQALAALGNTVYLASLGKQGFKKLAEQNLQKTHYLYEQIRQKAGLAPLYEGPFFHEFALRLPKPANEVIGAMRERGYFAGVDLGVVLGSEFEDVLLVAATEKRTKAEMDAFVSALTEVIA